MGMGQGQGRSIHTHTPPSYTQQLHPDWAWGLSFLVTLFTFVTGGILMRAGNKIDECVSPLLLY